MSSESHTERNLHAQIAELEATVARVQAIADRNPEPLYPPLSPEEYWSAEFGAQIRAALTPEPLSLPASSQALATSKRPATLTRPKD